MAPRIDEPQWWPRVGWLVTGFYYTLKDRGANDVNFEMLSKLMFVKFAIELFW